MSQANIPNTTPSISITRNDAFNLLLTSIALEEIGLSRILNAKEEQIQFVLGTLLGSSGPATPVGISDLLAFNDSVQDMLHAVTKKEILLQNKLKTILQASATGVTCVCPTEPSTMFARNNVVIPMDATITELVFSIRDEILTAVDSISGEIFRSTNCGVTATDTGIIATVTGPNPSNCCAVATGSVPVNQCDLLSVKITRFGKTGDLIDGAAATIILTIP